MPSPALELECTTSLHAAHEKLSQVCKVLGGLDLDGELGNALGACSYLGNDRVEGIDYHEENEKVGKKEETNTQKASGGGTMIMTVTTTTITSTLVATVSNAAATETSTTTAINNRHSTCI